MLKKIVIKNYKVFRDFVLDLAPGMNVVVGDNAVGKSTLLEAVNLALTGRLNGAPLAAELSPFLFNLDAARTYTRALRSGGRPVPPEILIEAYFEDAQDGAPLLGQNNSLREDVPGVRIRVSFNEDFREEYDAYVADPAQVTTVPAEYYKVDWLGFDGNGVTARSVPATASLIDATAIRLQRGADAYLQTIIGSNLEPNERVELSRSYRSLRETFSGIDAVAAVNEKLAGERGDISDRRLTLSIDLSQRSGWERSLVPHLDDLPFPYVGKGEQSTLKILLALNRKKVKDTHVVLIEEPENHVSFSTLNQLIDKVIQKCAGKQVLVTTHSAYILNKLGLNELVLLSPQGGHRITDLPPSTVDYFKKLPGYDTLRLVLAKRAILVEGPSDELIVQRAYLDVHGKPPIADGVDVINVRGLSAKRFLDLAVPLRRCVAVVNDNDGDVQKMAAKYAGYSDHDFISIHIGKGDPNTLEPQVIAVNGLQRMNEVLGTSHQTEAAVLTYMLANKTTWALAVAESTETIVMPEYIVDAVSF
ncbi:ATP-dependent endonuclease [Dactylosporangium cerinum]|uniref:ATP-dependent endonuclease n=1 Tax=Dactylosporangium cerinum TaxID=1434730 RepID=A0ABV9W0P1_9ACTN